MENINNIPNIMYFGTNNKIDILRGRVFLTPYMGIASIFIIAKDFFKSLNNCNYNKSYEEWNIDDSKLVEPLEFIHLTHNVKEIDTIETGESIGYIYKIDVTNVKNGLSVFVTNDSNREVVYTGDEPLKIIEVTEHKVKWSCQFSEQNVKHHGYGEANAF